jgi:hypothetical protein
MASPVNGREVTLAFSRRTRKANPIGEAAGSSVTTVDHADIRALVSRQTVEFVTELPRSKIWGVAASAIQ